MPAYYYVALNDSGEEVRGRIAAVHARTVAAALRQRKLAVVRVSRWPTLPSSWTRPGSWRETLTAMRSWLPVPRDQKIHVLRHLVLALGSGVSVTEALDHCAESETHSRAAQCARGMRLALLAGCPLSQALAHRAFFDDVVIHAVKAAEAGGDPRAALEQALDYLQRAAAWRRKLLNSLAYPMLVAALSTMMLSILMFKILPAFVEQFVPAQDVLAEPAQRLLRTLQIGQWGCFAGLGAGLAGIGTRFWMRATGRGQPVWDRLVVRIPWVGPLVVAVLFSRICHTLSVMIRAQVPLEEAMRVASRSAGNGWLSQRLDRCVRDLRAGRRLSLSAQVEGLPAMFCQAIASGEQTGALGTTLRAAGDYFDQEAETRMSRVVTLVEPVLMLAIVLIVGFFVVTIYTATLEIRTTLVR